MNEERLLEGEDPKTVYREDAHHWVRVYGELLTFKDRLIETADTSVKELNDSAARYEAQATDVTLLRAERDRLSKRLDFWRRKYRRLSKPR